MLCLGLKINFGHWLTEPSLPLPLPCLSPHPFVIKRPLATLGASPPAPTSGGSTGTCKADPSRRDSKSHQPRIGSYSSTYRRLQHCKETLRRSRTFPGGGGMWRATLKRSLCLGQAGKASLLRRAWRKDFSDRLHVLKRQDECSLGVGRIGVLRFACQDGLFCGPMKF